ncbi:MAG: hypothetical protein AAFX62_17175, partial [Pseudomonadota bacterium]
MQTQVLAGPDERRRYRGLKPSDTRRLDIGWGEAGSIAVPAGSVISITTVDGGAPVWLTALTGDARGFLPDALDLAGVATCAI